jgi:hypothetical protein
MALPLGRIPDMRWRDDDDDDDDGAAVPEPTSRLSFQVALLLLVSLDAEGGDAVLEALDPHRAPSSVS